MASLRSLIVASATFTAALLAMYGPFDCARLYPSPKKSASDHQKSPLIRTVHVVFSNHLDVGFHSNLPNVPGTDAAVLSRYFRDYFPAAIATANALRRANASKSTGASISYRYLTHSWLVSLYLDCPAVLDIYCPSQAEIAAFEAAVRRGDITWHAMPHNAEAEFFQEPDFLRWAVQGLTHGLDKRFALPKKRVVSQRDVPGLTRAAIPILSKAGVLGISVGVNGGSAPPAVPLNTPFWWKDEATGTKLLAFWHANGYSGSPVDSGTDGECVHVAGLDQVLCNAWRGDNEGPHSPDEVESIFKRLRADFPHTGTQIVASDMDAFVDAVIEAVHSPPSWPLRFMYRGGACAPSSVRLDEISSEIGDTWIHGVASDPVRVSEYRHLLRMWRTVVQRHSARTKRRDLMSRGTNGCKAKGLFPAALHDFARLLVKVPEHTWGTDTKQYPGDYTRWNNTDFQSALTAQDAKFEAAIDSWRRQRSYVAWAVEALGETDIGKEAKASLEALRNNRGAPAVHEMPGGGFEAISLPPPTDADSPAASTSLKFENAHWKMALDPKTGALISLQSVRSSLVSSERGKMAGSPTGRNCDCDPQRHSSSIVERNGSGAPNGGGYCNGTEWIGPDGAFAELVYSTYDEESFDVIWSTYAYRPSPLPDWFYKDFGKPNATVLGGAQRRDVTASLRRIWHRKEASSTSSSLHVIAELGFPKHFVKEAGAPAKAFVEYRAVENSPELLIDITWVNKTASRLPEAMWLSWRPSSTAVDPKGWKLSKLGSEVAPTDVMRNGSMGLHAVDDMGVKMSYKSAHGTALRIVSLDAALVCAGKPSPFPRVQQLPNMSAGVSTCLVNNIWGTNYPMWYPYDEQGVDMRFRFVLQVEVDER